MKTTLNIPASVMSQLKQEAARRGVTMSELVEAALRRLLADEVSVQELPSLPRFPGGRPRVDVSNRDALYRAMGGR
ncbi:MAG: ribbon-helix-helix protein, CopG family [Actinomycetota bacterium]